MLIRAKVTLKRQLVGQKIGLKLKKTECFPVQRVGCRDWVNRYLMVVRITVGCTRLYMCWSPAKKCCCRVVCPCRCGGRVLAQIHPSGWTQIAPHHVVFSCFYISLLWNSSRLGDTVSGNTGNAVKGIWITTVLCEAEVGIAAFITVVNAVMLSCCQIVPKAATKLIWRCTNGLLWSSGWYFSTESAT